MQDNRRRKGRLTMTVFEYFDYEKQLMEDLKAVKTQRAKDAIYDSILKVLDDHKAFVTNTMREFEARAQESAKHIVQAYRGETPDYVKKLMAEFGFYELEEAEDFCMSSAVPSHMKKDISRKLPSLCKADEPEPAQDDQKRHGMSDEEAEAQNVKILANAGLDDEHLDDILKSDTESDGSDKAKAAEKAKIDVEEFLKAAEKKQKRPSSKKTKSGKGRGKAE